MEGQSGVEWEDLHRLALPHPHRHAFPKRCTPTCHYHHPTAADFELYMNGEYVWNSDSASWGIALRCVGRGA